MFDPVELPVMQVTARLLEDLRAREEDVDAHEIADAIYGDPLMTVKVFAHVASVLRGREMAAPETVTGALVLLGIAPFFRAFGPQSTVEDRLGSSPEALAGFNALLRRAHRAADFALAFAVHRMDDDAHNIHTAALLHDLAEILLWLHAPEQALEIARRQSADRSLRSAAVQRDVLHIELSELQVQLLAAWRLPPLLVALSDPKRASASTAVRNVNLAIRVARHSANGWDDPALPDDVNDVSQLLQLAPDATWRLLRNVES